MLLNKIIRRILGEPNSNGRRQRAALQTIESSFDQNPPEYSTIVSANLTTAAITNPTPIHDHFEQFGTTPPGTNDYNLTPSLNTINSAGGNYRHQQISNTRRHTTTNFPSQKSLEKMDSFSSTMPRRQSPAISSSSSNDRCNFRNLTANDVAQLLRSTPNTQLIRSETNSDSIDSSSFPIDSDNLHGSIHEQEDYSITRSVEELILNEVPIGESNAAATFCDK